MRCLVIGCGSIGSRRARILAEMGHEVWACDRDEQKAIALKDEGMAVRACEIWCTAVEWADSYGEPIDAAFICTPPNTHVALAMFCVDEGIKGLFVEKPLGLTKDAAFSLGYPDSPSLVTMGACNMRFDERVALARDKMIGAPWYAVRMGQHEKYWSPTHEKQTMILDDIHELDLLRYVVGPIKAIRGVSDTQGAVGHTEHERGPRGLFILDRWTDPPVRTLAAFPQDGPVVKVNLWPPDPEMYRREMEHFLGCVESGIPTCNPLAQAAETLKWALEVVG